MLELSAGITEPLLEWFRENRRPLPWREDREPYHVWVSEIMLQQTRIEAVMRYYTDFMAVLPDIRSLSEIPEEQLLKLWEGLGYYSRARNLQRAAKAVTEQYGGGFPDTYDAIIKLPGIGEYTAGAIASICFNEKTPAVDGNVLRVLARVTGDARNVLDPATKKDFTAGLKQIMPETPGEFNEALMELGELVCLPNGAPVCDRCPLREQCAAQRDGLTEALPVRIKKTKRRQEEKTVLLIEDGEDRIAIEKREGRGLLSGMYQLPMLDGYQSEEEIRQTVSDWGLDATEIAFFKNAKHVFTHIDWLMKGFTVKTDAAGGRFTWVTRQQLAEQYPLPTAFKPFITL